MATKPYIKLDLDWREDPKVMDYEDRYGKAALVDLVMLFCALGEGGGTIDMKDNGQKLHLQRVVGKKGKPLETWLDRVAECGLIDADAWHAVRRIGSERSIRDGTARQKRRQYAAEASFAAACKRRERAEADARGEP